MNFANLERTEKNRKQWHGCHVLLIFVKTLFTFDDLYPSRFSYHGILLRSLVNHASRAWCPVLRHADNLVQSRVTLQILEPSRVTQITFPTLLILVFGPTQFSHLASFFRMRQIAHCTGTWDRKNNGNPLKRWRIMTRKKNLSTSFKRALFEFS